MSTNITEELRALIQKEYCPPLDETVVLAILPDYDTVEEARAVLDILKLDTTEDEGIHSGHEFDDWAQGLSEDDTIATSTSMKSEEQDEENKPSESIMHLMSMFPTLGTYTLKHTLDKSHGDVDRAIDELLNKSFLHEEGEGGKGIDGFAEEINLSSRKKEKKKKGRKSKLGDVSNMSSASSSSSSSSNLSRWDEVNAEVEYLAFKLNLPKANVASAFHKYGSRAACLQPLIRAHGNLSEMIETPEHLENMHALTALYPRLKLALLNGLLKLSHENLATAREFAALLDRYEQRKLFITTPPPSKPASITSPTLQSLWTTIAARSPLPASPVKPSRPVSHWEARSTANAHADARSEAYDKASAAHRKAKSDRYMGGVASYYADIGKAHTAQMKAYDSAAAEALVNENSTANALDLHGVTVQQAVQITKERVTEWWVITKSRESKAITPFHVITGLGRHSKNGETRIGPAVSKMLIRENWKIEVNQGHITVLGVNKVPVGK